MAATRKYTLKKRAEQQEETRARITRAAMELHEEVGPALTTISAIADRAGVERLTVYRHFPDDRAILQACSGLYAELHPLPDPAAWQSIGEPAARARAALSAIYAYHRATQRMFSRVIRDEDQVPAVKEVITELRTGYFAPVRDGLAAAWGSRRRELSAAIAHALDFTTWQSLERAGVGDERKAEMMVRWLEALEGAEPRRNAAARSRVRRVARQIARARRRPDRTGAE